MSTDNPRISFWRRASALVLTLAVWNITVGCADMAAACFFMRVQLFPSWLVIAAPLVTVLVVNPWYWIKYGTHSPFRILCGWKRYSMALFVVLLLWALLVCEIRSKVIAVEFIRELDETETACLYKSLGKHWSYDAKHGVIYIRGDADANNEKVNIEKLRQRLARKRNGDVSGQTDK